MKPKSKYSDKQLRAVISDAWTAFRLQAERVAYSELHCAITECEKGERAHRAMGDRFTHGRAAYRLPIPLTARFHVMVHAFREVGKPESWLDAAHTRLDVVYARAVGEILRDRALDEAAFPSEEFSLIDYAEDIAS